MAEAMDLSGWLDHPHRIAVDGKGYVWRVFQDDVGMWSMAPTNPDNSATPLPITWYVPESDVAAAVLAVQADNNRRIEALADEWDTIAANLRFPGMPPETARRALLYMGHAAEIRAALASPAEPGGAE